MPLGNIIEIDDIVEHIINKCDLQTLDCLSSVSKHTREITRQPRIKLQIEEFFPDFFKEYIDYTKLASLSPRQIVNDLRCGITGYIDYLTFGDFDTRKTNIVYGYDLHGRFFISTMYIRDDKPKRYIATFFQRYTSSPGFYVSCGNTYTGGIHCQTYNFVSSQKNDMTGTQYEILFQLLNCVPDTESTYSSIRLAPTQ
jgi:hypothetical protein